MNTKNFFEPITNDWAWLDELTGEVDEDFVEALSEKAPEQDRPELAFFK
jgi:antitoxin VapB